MAKFKITVCNEKAKPQTIFVTPNMYHLIVSLGDSRVHITALPDASRVIVVHDFNTSASE
jgi:hypothetical protein